MRHPHVHPEIQVVYDEDELLEAGEIEGVHRYRVALLDRARDEEDRLVSPREKRGAEMSPAPSASARSRAHALDVEDTPGTSA
jgi:hypothetical protein